MTTHGPGHSGHSRILVDDVQVPIMRLANGRLMCNLLMFQQFESAEELATALRRVRGELWENVGDADGAHSPIRTRPNVYDIDDAELGEFIHAVQEIKHNGIYDDFVRRHDAVMTDGSNIHGGPAFLPWHRVFIREFEQSLQNVSARIRLPFWNWIGDAALGKNARLWQAHGHRIYFGGDGETQSHRVTNGPCALWRILIHTNQGPMYRSGLGLDRRLAQGFTTMPQPAQLRQVFTVSPYDSAPWDETSDTSRSFRNALEGFWETGSAMHNRIHGWIGGDMAAPTSPNDPVFFLHHAFVDYIWAYWQKLHSSEMYQPEKAGPPGQNIDDPMPHLRTAVTPRQTLDPRAMGYEYPAASPI